MTITLRGMTWSHPRGYDPMVAASSEWRTRTGVDITWDKRSLQDFESFPVATLAERYDLIVIDHPHVGQITHENCLLPVDMPGRETELGALARGSVGQSFPSYFWQGRQWAFPIDAATQVQAWRPDLIERPTVTWAETIELAKAGRMALPFRPPHSLMTFFTLAKGEKCRVEGPELIGRDDGIAIYEKMAELAALIDSSDFDADPIAIFEKMALPDSRIAMSPLIYGYVPYAKAGFRPRLIGFADMPTEDGGAPVGSALGGTGIAVSSRRSNPAAAVDFAYWIASGEVQRGLFAASGGQPGHAAAWEDDGVNAAAHDFYRATRRTLEGAFVRPRHDGYMGFQEAASRLLTESLRSGGRSAGSVVDELNRLFAASLPR